MKLHIENFAAISVADLHFDGLTVIAGNNNTGKSTVGKVLYTFFRSLSNLDKRVQTERFDAMRAAFSDVPRVGHFGDVIPLLLAGKSPNMIVEEMLESFWSMGGKLGGPVPSDAEKATMLGVFTRTVSRKLEDAHKLSDIEYGKHILLTVFGCVFHGQFHPLQPSEGVSRLALTVKDQENLIELGHEGWSYRCPTKFLKKARLIATPDILSYVNIPNLESDANAFKYFDKYTFEIIKDLRQESSLSASGQICSDKLLQAIYQQLDDVIQGVFKRDTENHYALYEKSHVQPTKAENLSMGLKAFVLLRFMLEKGVLSEKDVLILDEPENHLHPEWQVAYAQLLVLLQKTFHLTMMVTTHSNFFVNALQRFCISEGIQKESHFYLSQADMKRPGFFTFKLVKNSSEIIRSFNSAYDMMDERSGA